MILYDIPDVRLFWSTDERFLSQFKEGVLNKFKPFSKHPAELRDISLFLPETFEQNDFFELAREVGGELLEKVEIIDEFYNKKLNKKSICFRLSLRSMERSMTSEEVNKIHATLEIMRESYICKERVVEFNDNSKVIYRNKN